MKKSIKNNDVTKVNKKEGKFTDNSGRVLLNNFLSALLRTQRSYQSIHSQFFVLVVINFMTEIFPTVDSWV